MLEEVAAQMSLGSAKAVRAVLKAAADAESRLIYGNVRLVHKVANQYRSPGFVSYEDLVQVG